MVQTFELRIGNWIYWTPKLESGVEHGIQPIQVEVWAMYPDRIAFLSSGAEHRSESFEDDKLQQETPWASIEEFIPIPLQTDWLDKLAFTKADDVYYKNGFQLTHNRELSVFQYDKSGNHKIVIEHVHQLQNVYFAMEGADL